MLNLTRIDLHRIKTPSSLLLDSPLKCVIYQLYEMNVYSVLKMMCNRYEEQQQTKRVFLASYSTRRVYTPFDKLVTSIVSTN